MYLGDSGKYQFHSIELKKEHPENMSEIIEACKAVEAQVWRANENFESYIAKQSALFYAKHQDEIVAFALFDVTLKDKSLVVSANECMILPQHQGNGLSNLFPSIMISHIRYDRRHKKERREYDKIFFLSLTVNFKLMSTFKRYSFLTLSDSFSPCEEIHEIAHEYLKKENIYSLHSSCPYFIKAAFPKSLIENPNIDVPIFVPKNFDLQRGDAFLYICKIRNFFILAITAWFVQRKFKFKFKSHLKKHLVFKKRKKANSLIYSDHQNPNIKK